MNEYQKLEWLHSQISELKDGVEVDLETMQSFIEDLREPYLMSKEIEFKYHGISGNIFIDDDIDIADQVFEMVNQYLINEYGDGISRAEFIEEDIEV